MAKIFYISPKAFVPQKSANPLVRLISMVLALPIVLLVLAFGLLMLILTLPFLIWKFIQARRAMKNLEKQMHDMMNQHQQQFQQHNRPNPNEEWADYEEIK